MNIFGLIKFIWPYLKSRKRLILWCTFLSTTASVVSAVIPIVYGRLVDEVVKNGAANLTRVVITIVAWFVFVVITGWMARYVSFQGEIIGLGAYHSFLVDVYDHYLKLPLGFHKDKKGGEQINKIDRASSYVGNIISNVLFNLVPGFLSAAVAIALMFSVEWRLSILITIVLSFYTYITIKKTKPIIKSHKMINREWEKFWGRIFDSSNNIDSVKNFVREEKEINNIKNHGRVITSKMKEVNWLWRKLDAWQNNIQGLTFVLVFAISIYLMFLGQMTAGLLITFIGYVNLVFRPFAQLADNYRTIQKGISAISVAVKLFDLETEKYGTGKKLKEVNGKVEFRNLCFSYLEKGKHVLSGINFTADPGQMIALVGESGTGKTTLLSLLSRYYHPTKGKIFLDGVDLNNLELSFLRDQIAVVPQEISLFNETLKNNLIYAGKNVTEKQIVEALKAANAWSFVERLPKKLNQIVGERGIKLSTGQKQRIAIARAILRNPKILILDEATSALDSISERLVQEALKRLIAGRTTFVIAHRLSTIVHSDKILVFDKGQLVEQGKHDELVLKDGVYAKLYKEQKF
jgi:ABC-type multidrug transport system fused ATPase/permease subunit